MPNWDAITWFRKYLSEVMRHVIVKKNCILFEKCEKVKPYGKQIKFI